MLNKFKKPALILVLLSIIYILIPIHLERFQDYGKMVLDEDDRILRIFLNSQQQWCLPPAQTDIPTKLEKAVLTFEDKTFYYHPGVNPWSLLRAVYLNIKHGKVISGGSTITMQVARISSQKSRTIPQKILEILQAIKLEVRYSKKQILRMYLDHAPYGRNIVGFRAAALKYFTREPENLTWSEAALLAVLPNSPGLISPGQQQQILLQKRNKLLDKLVDRGIINPATCTLGKLEPVPETCYSIPVYAPHLSRRAARDTESNIIRTTINKDIQSYTETILKQYSEYLKTLGIGNTCALICRTDTGEIVAYCGSQDFWDIENQGQVDGIIAPRSPGSTLKPFLYSLCIDEGILVPETKLIDVPTYFGAFSPENANKQYDGLVTAHEALVRSLNVPAVRLLYTLGLEKFYYSLKAAGISTLFRRPDEYGLTLIIGGSEATLLDLTALFRGLGNEGRFGELTWNRENKFGIETELISPAACYLTLDMMQDVMRPGAEYYWHQYEDQSPLAWKTGTSYGNRDAWAIGVNPQWTIGVWAGNFNGEGNPTISGAATAGPILFEIFNSLPKNPDMNWFDLPVNYTTAEICTESGYLASDCCSKTKTILVPDNKKPLKFCPFHKKRFLDLEENYIVCSHCWQEGNYQIQNVLEYPPVVAKYLKKRGQSVPHLKTHNPLCDWVQNNNTLEIIYPTDGAVIYIPKDFGGIKQKMTIKIANMNKNPRVFWYLDSVYLSSTTAKEELSINIEKGSHKIYITDETGNESKVQFKIISQ